MNAVGMKDEGVESAGLSDPPPNPAYPLTLVMSTASVTANAKTSNPEVPARPDLHQLSDDIYQDYPATLPAATFARINRSACGINTLAKMLEGSLIADGCDEYPNRKPNGC